MFTIILIQIEITQSKQNRTNKIKYKCFAVFCVKEVPALWMQAN